MEAQKHWTLPGSLLPPPSTAKEGFAVFVEEKKEEEEEDEKEGELMHLFRLSSPRQRRIQVFVYYCTWDGCHRREVVSSSSSTLHGN